jgi:hypothetical protein
MYVSGGILSATYVAWISVIYLNTQVIIFKVVDEWWI